MNLDDLAEMQKTGEYNPRTLEWKKTDLPVVAQTTVLKKVDSGEIRLELGADGVYLQFDCDCLDALPYCKAHCCSLIGTMVLPDELAELNYPVEFDSRDGTFVMERSADGFCKCLDRQNRTCGIYENRPRTCKEFHCTRGFDVRGWKLANHVDRQSLM